MQSAQPAPPFAGLSIDLVIDAVESLGYLSDLRVFPLNSYENRVYQVGMEEGEPLIAKFYRPQRWTKEQILEEHSFSLELAEAEIPVVPPITKDGVTLFEFKDFYFSLSQRRGGHAPELDNLDTLYTLGQHMGRIHAIGAIRPFAHRREITLQNFAIDSRDVVLACGLLPPSLEAAYSAVSEQLIALMAPQFERTPYTSIRLHGDCHPGNILTRPDSMYIVDLDDACSGPAIQDLWMLLSGDMQQKKIQMAELAEGYDEFYSFTHSELALIEPLRTMRLMHYAAWLARRWHDPAFPQAFPWFNTERYWAEHIQELKEQLYLLNEAPLTLRDY